ncbi:MAG: sugar transferase, partial [Anaerolineales bacterium]|nr:sugar transferase [Anaerolineales bacterium]
MLRRFSVNFAVFSIFFDVIVIDFVLWLTAFYRPLFNALNFTKIVAMPMTIPWVLYFIFPLTWVAIMLSFGVYDGRKNLKVVDEFSTLTWSAMFAGVTMAGVLYLSYRDVSRISFIVFVLAGYLLFLIWRIIARVLYRQRNRQENRIRSVLIVGAGSVGSDVADRVLENAHFGIQLTGFLDDDARIKPGIQADVLGTINDIHKVVLAHHVDDVVVALPLRAHERVSNLTTTLQELPVRIWLIPDYFSLTLHHAEFEDFVGLPMMDLRAPALSESQRMLKRVFDVLVTALMLVPLLPIMALVVLAILLDDGRPILFRQKRAGENGRVFKMYKFRTMLKGAEKMQAQVSQTDDSGNLIHKRKDDPRVTRVGRFLRRYSLDELPQFFNVLRGTMSLVGPRPEMPSLVKNYQPWQRKRFSIPQGMTGWWQIHGRSDKPMHLHT